MDIEAYIFNNTFISNKAVMNSSAIYIKDFNRSMISNNLFWKNNAEYGTCIYSVQQSSKIRSIISSNKI